MKCVLLTGVGLEHIFVANELSKTVELDSIIVETGRKRTRWQKVRRAINRYGFFGMLERAVLAGLRFIWRDEEKRRYDLIRIFGAHNCEAIHRQDLTTIVDSVNSKSSHQHLKSRTPDVVLVYGTGIVTGKTLEIARVINLNMHTGISPYYRGAACHFWPLHDGRPNMVGATVHECVMDVDGGQIFATAQAKLEENDGIHAAFARAVVAGTRIYTDVILNVLRASAKGSKQDLAVGKEWRVADRGLISELRTRRMIRRGLIRDHVRSQLENRDS